MSWEGMAGSGKNEEMNRLKIRMRSGQRTILEEVGTKTQATGRGGGEMRTDVAVPGDRNKNHTSISKHTGENIIKIINEI